MIRSVLLRVRLAQLAGMVKMCAKASLIILVAQAHVAACVAKEGTRTDASSGRPIVRITTDGDGYLHEVSVHIEPDGREVPHGRTTIYRPDGIVYMVEYYNMGTLDGMFVKYDQRGDIEIEGEYRNGVLSGTRKTWHRDMGQIEYDTYWQGGRYGPSYTTTLNGKILSQETYVNNQLHGISLWIDYGEGIVVFEQYVDGNPSGQQVKFELSNIGGD